MIGKNATKKKMNESLELKAGSKAIVIVAHPDDEVIWSGGVIITRNDIKWRVLSLCRQSDADREPKFKRVSAELGVEGEICDLDDDGHLSDEESIEAAKNIIKEKVGRQHFDVLLTHGENGEYGHRLHKHVHEAVLSLLENGEISADSVLFFDYQKLNRKILPMIPAENSDVLLELKPKVYEKKRQIVAEMYGYPYDGIDVNLCTNVEAFKRYK